MSGPKRQAKHATRAERRTAEEAAQQARAEQAAKERKQQTIIDCIVVTIIVVLAAIAGFAVYKAIRPSNTNSSSQQSNMAVNEAYNKLKKASTQPTNAGDKAGFVVSNKGYGQKAEGVPTVSIYMEPLCPGCASVNRQLNPTLVKLMNAGQLNVDLYFLNFQNNRSPDDYSNHVFNGAIYIAKHSDDPDYLMSYLSDIYAKDFQPDELSNYKPVNNAKPEKQVAKTGVSEDVAAAAFSGKNECLDWLTASSNYTILRPELFNSSGAFSSPTLTISGGCWDLKQLTLADTDMVDGFLKFIELDADQVDVEGKVPSIDTSGRPISVAS